MYMTIGADPLIRLTSVAKAYHETAGERVVFEDATLSVARGEWLFLLGRSGSGKSTLLNLISGIDLPDRGDVEVAGASLTRMSERERTLFRREKIGFVFQFYNLIPTLTVEENILLPLELMGRIGSAERRRAAELLEQVGLADRCRSFPEQLSGGEQQRVAVARALIHRPAILLADEPTGNLDSHSADQVLELISALGRSGDTTLVLVTHSSDVARLADRRMTIIDGQLSELPGTVGQAL